MDYHGRDGVRLAYEDLGTGRPVVLLHGRLDRGAEFIESGLAERLIQVGCRVVLPDMRGHGASDKPHDPALWPTDIHTDDALALLEHLGLVDYDLLGHSLDGRTVVRMLVRGASPRRAVVSGQGLAALTDTSRYLPWMREFLSAWGTGTFEPGSDQQETEDWMRATGADAKAVLLSLDSYLDTTTDDLATVTTSTLVLTGRDEIGNQTADALAGALGAARHLEVPGDHFTAKTSSEFAAAVLDFLR